MRLTLLTPMKTKLIYLFSLLSLVLFSSCGGGRQSAADATIDSDYSQYISSYTSGSVSCLAPIVIEFAQDPVNPGQPGEEAPKELIRLKPEVNGQLKWVDSRTIAFEPTERMKSDAEYRVQVAVGKALGLSDDKLSIAYTIKTIPQSFSLNKLSLKSYDSQNLKMQYFSGVVFTSDCADNKQVEELVDVRLDGDPLQLSWNHETSGKKHQFRVDSLLRKDVAREIRVSWNGAAIGDDKKGEEKIELPALDVFKVVDVMVVQQPEQYLLVRFSDPLLPQQNLDGLVSIDQVDKLRYQAEQNELKVYVPSRLSGDHEVYISGGIKNALNFKLGQSTTMNIRFEDLKPAVKLVGKGTILPASTELNFPFESVNLNAVDIRIIQIYTNNIHQFFQGNQYSGSSDLKQVGRLLLEKKIDLSASSFNRLKNWNTFNIDIRKLIKVEPGAIYRIQLRFKKDYSLYGLEQLPTQNQSSTYDALAEEQKRKEEQERWDSPGWYSDYDYPDGYEWRERNNPEHVSYFNSDRFVSRNLFATNIGIVAKGGASNRLRFAVSNLISTEPMAGVALKIYNYQKQLITTVQTDGEGMASVDLKSKPFLLVAEKDGQFAYLRLDDGSSLSLSNFDVGGQVVQKGIKGYVYGERGVWRPGDKIYLTLILEDEQQQLPENHPVIFELINPKGQTISRQVKTAGENGFYSFMAETDAEAPTGSWTAVMKVGGQEFTKRIKVETVKPNRLKIGVNFKSDPLCIYQGYADGELKTAWLHGGKAKNLKANVDLSFSPKKTSFDGYFNFAFDDPAKNFYAEEQEVFKGRVDENGLVKLDFQLPKISSAPGMLNAHFSSRVYEETGDFSIDVKTVPYAPYSSFVGVKLPASDGNWYKTDIPYPLDIVTVDYKGNKIDRKNLEVTVYKVEWHWWWDSGRDNLARYVNNSYEKPVLRATVSTVDGKANLPLKIKYTDWHDNGRYLIHVKDPESGHSTGLVAYFSKWGYWAAEGSQEGATMLTFKTDKEKYQVGEKVTVTIPSAKQGKALVSLENGSDVVDLFWVDTQEQATTFCFDATPEMAPNIFLHISLIQPHAQTENDAPIRLYGAIPVFVEDPATHLVPELKVADELEPESSYEVQVSEKDGKEMTYTLAVVDEGLLDLTRFKTPDPWSVFYAREALGVKTWDYYDDVIGAYGAKLERAFAVGGDENLAAAKRKKANRFKPVVSFIGPFTVAKGKTNTHQLSMPNYVGAVRVMAVAGDKGAYGKAEKSVKVLKPLMLLATLPRVVGPGEEVSLPVNVFAMKPEVKNVRISVQANEFFELQDGASKQVQFSEPGDQLASFKLKVVDKTGIGKVKVLAESGANKASYEIEIDVRPSNPRVVNSDEQVIEPGKSWSLNVEAPGMVGTNHAKLELSAIPPIDLSRRLDYLIRYPHGCIEQTTSAVFPQLLLNKMTVISPEKQQEIEGNIRAALNRFVRFQTADGGFAYWPGNRYASGWGTNYAGHFLLKAELAGYSLPFGMKEKWLNYQKDAARNWQRSDRSYYRSELMQAYRLYTLALAQSPDFGAMNRLREEAKLDQVAQWRLAAAYAVAGQPEVANEMVRKLSRTINPFRELSYTFGSDVRDKAMILETLVLLKKHTDAFALVEEISKELSSDSWMSTQTVAYSLLSIAEFSGVSDGNSSQMDAVVTLNGSKQDVTGNNPVWQADVSLTNNLTAQLKVDNKSSKILYARVVSDGIPLVGDSTSSQSNLFMDVNFTDMTGHKIDPTQLAQGTDFVAEISIQNPGNRGVYKEMALTNIFPSGWEIINKRLNDVESSIKSDEFTYQDIRDDRVLTYFDLNPNERKTFRILLSATYEGKFYLPSVQCEAMYDNRINARRPGRWISVTK